MSDSNECHLTLDGVGEHSQPDTLAADLLTYVRGLDEHRRIIIYRDIMLV
jgi:hypothetical protein